MSYCECPAPGVSLDPRHEGTCQRCGHRFDPEWLADDETVAEFYDRLALSLPGEPTFPHFRALATVRERSGRPIFGLAYLTRDNVAEGAEEAADGANYALLEGLRMKRAGIDPADDLLLSAARHFALGYAMLAEAQGKHRGIP